MVTKKSIGLQITNNVLRYVELIRQNNQIKLGKFGEQKISTGILENGLIKRPQDFKKDLILLKKKINPEGLTVSFLADQVFLSELLKESGFNKVYFESVNQSLARLSDPENNQVCTMIIYFGENITEIAVREKKEIESFNVWDFGREVFESTKDQDMILSVLSEKIDEQFIAWHTEDDKRHKTRPLIKHVYLAGELPDLNRIAEQVSLRIRVPTEVLPVWGKMLNFDKYIPEMTQDEALVYSVPIGLAYRQFEK